MRPSFDRDAARKESLSRLPGLADHFEKEDPGMHKTNKVDYAVVFEGEIWLNGARKHFLFTAAVNYSVPDPNPIFGNIYFSARDHGQHVTYPLVPELESSLKRTA
jgi:hypothetical protein